MISELELHTLRARLTAGLLNKAQRGELALSLPAGLIRDPLRQVVKHPDQEVQGRLGLVFTTFLQVKSACQVVRFFNDHDLLLPRKDRFGDIIWRPPTVPAILSILKNPAYAGAFVYGRTRAVPRASAPHQRVQKPLPMAEWKVCHKDRYPAYIAWDTFEKIQTMVGDNHSEYDRNKNRGIPRRGKALLHGLVYCGACGHKMVVQYKNRTCYICNYLRQQYQVPVCQNLPGDPIDTYVVQAFLDALAPAELDLYTQAVTALRQEEEQLQQAQQQQLERLRYQARLAERQFNQSDPDNRLVTAELERRWEAALRELKEAEVRCQQAPPAPATETLRPEDRAAFLRWPKDSGVMAPRPLVASAAEGVPALSDRQGRRPPLGSRHASGPYCLERGCHHEGGPARDGGFASASPRPRRWKKRSSNSPGTARPTRRSRRC